MNRNTTTIIGRPKLPASRKRPILNTSVSAESREWLVEQREITGLSFGELIDELIEKVQKDEK